MKATGLFKCRLTLIFPLLMLLFTACSKDDFLREYEGVKIVGVKVNNELFTPVPGDDNITNIVVPAGRDLSDVKLQVLVANGELVNFQNEATYDCRKPLSLTLKGFNGQQVDAVLKIQSPPSLSSFIIEGVNVAREDIHFSSTSLIVQVPPATDLSNLKVTMEFVNGTLMDFTNGVEADYTAAKSFNVKGSDEETIYPYSLIITTEEVGPASIRSMTINGVPTDSVVLKTATTAVPYVHGLTNFANADVTLETGFGNIINSSFTGKGLNLLSGTAKVKITGSDGIEKEFTIGIPQLSLQPVFSKVYEAFGFGANDLCGVAFSGNYIVVSNYSAVAPVVVGPNYYNLSGEQAGVMNKTNMVIANSLRKVASDDKGAILGVPLGLTDNEQTIYKWDNVTSAPVAYIKYSKASLGVDYTPRSAGINVSGSLDGNAVITVGMAQKTEVFVWTVTGGVLNPTPQKYMFPYDKTSYYWSVEPLPIGTSGFVGAATGTNFNGLISLNSTLGEISKQTGIVVTDCRIKNYNGRMYLAYTAYASGKGAVMRVCDITDGQPASFQNPVMDVTMPSTAANGNNTMDADLAVINGKLYAVFACTNIGMRLYQLER